MENGYPFSQYTPDELQRACIYHIFLKDGAPQDEYIGQAIRLGSRWQSHISALRRGQNTYHLQRAWDKYGSNAFGWSVLEWIDSPHQLDDREQWYIDERQPRYNLCHFVGRSRLGVKTNPVTLAKMRVAQKHSRPPRIAVERSVATRTGQKQKPEHIAKRVATMKSHPPSERLLAYRASRRGMKTGPKPQPVRDRISQTKTGVKWTEARWKAQEARGYVPQTERQRDSTERLMAAAAKEHAERNERVYAALVARGWEKVVPMRRKPASFALVEETGLGDYTIYRALGEFEKQGILTFTLTPRTPLSPERRRVISEQMKRIRAGQEDERRRGKVTAPHPPLAPFAPPSSFTQGILFTEEDAG